MGDPTEAPAWVPDWALMVASGITLGGAVVAGLRSILADGPGVVERAARASHWVWAHLTPWGRVETAQRLALAARVATLEARQATADKERAVLLAELEREPPEDARADLVQALHELLALHTQEASDG